MHCKHGTYVGTAHGADHMCGWCEDGVEPWFTVETGVKGAVRITTRDYQGRDEAVTRAKRWASSNSIGSYWAVVRDPSGSIVAQYNL